MIILVATEDETWDEVRAIVGDMDIRDTMQREERNMKNDDENMEKEVKVESFTFDHRKVKAPYVRRCCVLDGPNGDKVTKFDLRFCQPNAEALETATLHGLEHLLAENLRRHIDGVIDLSPMGCRTGYYVTAWGERDVREMRDALVAALGDVLAATEIPAANEIQCGNWRDLSLEGAQDAARRVLDAGFSLDPFHRR